MFLVRKEFWLVSVGVYLYHADRQKNSSRSFKKTLSMLLPFSPRKAINFARSVRYASTVLVDRDFSNFKYCLYFI